MNRAGKCCSIGAFSMALILAAVLLSGCDIYNKSLDSYVEEHTGTVRLLGIEPAGEPVIIPPASEAAPESIVTVALENKQAYALRVTLLNNGVAPDPARIRADAPNAQNQVVIHIAGAATGDSFNLTLKLGIVSKKRNFDDITIPPIYCSQAIIAFSLSGSGPSVQYAGIVDEGAKTVAITVPHGIDRTSLIPAISFNGASINPPSGKAQDFTGPLTYTVTAADGSTQDYTVTVTSSAPGTVAVTGVSLDQWAFSLEIGRTETLTAAVMPADATNQTVYWNTSNSSVATVTGGVVTAVAAGTAVIMVTTADGGKIAGATVTVTSPAPGTVAVTGVSLDPSAFPLEIGETETLIATVMPADATNKTVNWNTSDSGVATVTGGVVTAVAAGTAVIGVTTADGGKIARATVTVTSPAPGTVAVTGVSLDQSAFSLEIGGTETLTATVAPADATNQTVTWNTSAAGVATVTGGVVTAVAAGTAVIEVTTADGGKFARATVTVTSPAPGTVTVTGVSLDQSAFSLEIGETETLTATVAPTDATNQTVTWNTSDAGVATVTGGVVTAIAAGTAVITVITADGLKIANAMVTVTPTPVSVSGVTLNKTTLSLAVGATETLTATVAPVTATNKAVTWSSSAPAIATVGAANGVVSAVAAGTAVIEVTTADGGKFARATVTVTSPAPGTVAVTGVSLDQSAFSLEIGETETLTATVAPTTATNQSVTWSSSDTTKATVANGVVTAVAAGTAVIMVTTADGGEIASATVTVTTPVGQGTISVSFSGAPVDESTALLGTPGSTLDWEMGSLSLSVPTTNFSGAAYKWYLDGYEISGQISNSYGPIAANTFTLATHQIMVRITTAANVVYSKSVTFKVE